MRTTGILKDKHLLVGSFITRDSSTDFLPVNFMNISKKTPPGDSIYRKVSVSCITSCITLLLEEQLMYHLPIYTMAEKMRQK